ncbi:MAG TPA: glutaredoxin family protein [Acidobacteriota bacterium]|nr:glutaredoxin family protein [Acidobacteriota bacterium]
MTTKLTLYSRKECCLCDAMKAVVRQVAEKVPIDFTEIDVDSDTELQAKFGNEVPVLFVEDRKAFKYRMTVSELTRRLTREPRPFFKRLSRAMGKETT